MFDVLELLKAFLLGIIEGITEWLPVSSTGHLILADEFIRMNQSDAFKEMFFVVIQLSAILAVIILYWNKLNPLSVRGKLALNHGTLALWSKILISCIPAGIIGILFDDPIDDLFYNYQTVAITLVLYGILFVVLENRNRNRQPSIVDFQGVTYRNALLIGLFQLLSLVPGTSRSGATILGAMLLGASRTLAAEYTFFMAVPVMFGASLIKLLKFGFDFTATEGLVLLTGMLVSFFGSILTIRFLIAFVRKHDFKVFGWYRIALGVVLAVYFIVKTF
jgi:undecaprenyl-diphosphatase